MPVMLAFPGQSVALGIGSATSVISLGLCGSLALFNEDSVRCKLREHSLPEDANEFVTAVALTFLINFHSSEKTVPCLQLKPLTAGCIAVSSYHGRVFYL